MEEKKLVPKRRFRGFEGEWDVEKLSRLSDVRDGTHDSPRYVLEGYPFITSKNVSNGYLSFEDIQYISKDDFDEINKRSKVDVNDILMGMIGTVGNLALIREEPNFAIKNVALIKDTKQAEQKYIYYFLQTNVLRNQLNDGMDGGTQKFISLFKIRNLNIYLSSIKEQQKIGKFFKVLDERIANQERKVAKMKALKEAYLTEMFPQEGEAVPKRRFGGFKGEWNLVSVKDLGDSYYGGGTPRTSSLEYWNGKIPWIQSSDLVEDVVILRSVKNKITELGLHKSATKLVPANSIAVVTRVGVGKLAFIPHQYTTSQDFLSISNLNVSYEFGTYSMYKLLKEKKGSVQGTSIKGMTKDELLSMQLLIPPALKEQQKIGKFFKNLDDQIATEETKLEKLKKTKEAYLEEMFV